MWFARRRAAVPNVRAHYQLTAGPPPSQFDRLTPVSQTARPPSILPRHPRPRVQGLVGIAVRLREDADLDGADRLREAGAVLQVDRIAQVVVQRAEPIGH